MMSVLHRYLLVATIMMSLPTASQQFPDMKSFLNFWDSQRPKAESPLSDSPQAGPGKVPSRARRAGPGDSSQDPYVVETSGLPMFKNGTLNDRYMPVLGNGVTSTSVYSKFIYFNGLYNGAGADSHRAQVPSIVMTRVKLDKELEANTIRRFKFDISEGVFVESIDCPFAYIEHRTYVHQKYVRLFVTDIKMTRKDEDGGILNLEYPDLGLSNDIQFEQAKRYRNAHWKVSGRTKVAEQGASTTSFHSFFFERHKTISVITEKTRHEIMVQSVGIMESDAQHDFDKAKDVIRMTNGITKLFDEHKEAWRKTWKKGKIEVFGELQLAKITLFSQYYLLASMPPMFASKPLSYNTVYSSIARNSLARGSKNKDYHGHIFWDNEMYLMPAVVLFHPNLAKAILRIRSATSAIARDYATMNGHKGYQFAWESGFTGHDVTPDSCIDCRNNALHVTGAVGWSIRQYYSATRDQDYMTNPEFNGCDMTKEIARFWASLAVYNNFIGRYDIHNVTGPDDWHPKVTNNAYTNVMASLAIHWGRYFACLCGRNERDEVPDEWMAVAEFLEIPFDNEKRTHHQFQGYEKLPSSNQTNKQADTIMLTYPLNWNMSRDIMRNDLELYELKIAERTPAMTYSFLSVGYKWGDDPGKMDQYFQKSYEDYVIQPFKIWSEYLEHSEADQQESTVNYLPGMGGYLQSLIYGYAGIRIRPEFLEFHHPTPPPRCHKMVMTSFDYLGTEMDIEVMQDRVVLTIIKVGDYPLILKRNATSMLDERLTVGAIVTIDDPKQGFYIFTSEDTACDHPRDFIYMPWGYNPWLSSAPTLRTHLSVTFIPVILLLLLTLSV